MKLSEQILKYRKLSGLTQEQLAADLGVTPQSVSNWERGGAPDISMLPVIAGYFRISIDELMGYNAEANAEDYRLLERELDLLRDDPAAYLDRLLTEHRRFPKDWQIKHRVVLAVSRLPAEHRNAYLPFLEEMAAQFYEQCPHPLLRDDVIATLCALLSPGERERWLKRLPHGNQTQLRTRADCLYTDGNYAEADVWYDFLRLTELENLLVLRSLDQLGPEKKAENQRRNLALIDALCTDGTLPAAWLSLHAYETLVLSACLFACDRPDDAWTTLRTAVDEFEQWFALPADALLPTGFGDLRMTKDHRSVRFPDGKREFISSTYISHMTRDLLRECLNDRNRWAWFNSVRDDPRFLEIVRRVV